MRQFNYSSDKEVKLFRSIEEELSQFLKNGDVINVVKPDEYTTERANTPSGFELFKTEGIFLRCIVGKDIYDNLIVEECAHVRGGHFELKKIL